MGFKNEAEVKQFLREYRSKKKLTELYYKRYEDIKKDIEKTGQMRAVNITGMPSAKNNNRDIVSQTIEQLEEIKEMYIKELWKLMIYRKRAEKMIKLTEDDENIVISNIYIDGKNAFEISAENNMSEGTVYRKLKSGIEKILEKYKNDSE